MVLVIANNFLFHFGFLLLLNIEAAASNSISLNLMEIVPAILDLVDNLNSPTVNKNKKGNRSGFGYCKQFSFSSKQLLLLATA